MIDFGFVDRYVERKAHMLLRIRSRDGQEYLACLQRSGGTWNGWDPTMGDRESLSVIAGKSGIEHIDCLLSLGVTVRRLVGMKAVVKRRRCLSRMSNW